MYACVTMNCLSQFVSLSALSQDNAYKRQTFSSENCSKLVKIDGKCPN